MPRPDPRAPGAGQSELFEVEASAVVREGQVTRGRHSDAMDRAIAAASEQHITDDVDEGLTTVLRAGAWALDVMELRNQSYGPSKLIPAITEALREARMTPEARQGTLESGIADLLTQLGSADLEGEPSGTPISDTAP